MAAKGMIARYLGLAVSGERALADAFVLVGLRHAAEPELRNAARLYSTWCRAHVDALRAVVDRYGAARCREGERLQRALFRGRRMSGFGLVRDVHDLLTLATAVHGCWTALQQAAREQRDRDLEAVCRACDAETTRQISWLETKLRQSAPQALTVPRPTGRDLLTSIPGGDQVGAIIDLVPGPALRRLVPTTSAVAMLVVFGFVLVMVSSYPGRAH
jgi:hypothetical protein